MIVYPTEDSYLSMIEFVGCTEGDEETAFELVILQSGRIVE